MKKFTSTLSVALIIVAILSACGHDIEDLQGTILGKVTDSSTGESLAGCIITITPGTTSRTTGSDGYFEFQDLTPQQYEIQVRKDGYHSDTKLITIVAGQTASGDMQLKKITSDSKMRLSVTNLNFGHAINSLSFSIINEGQIPLNWNISGLENIDWLDFSPWSGTIDGGKSHAVKVTLDRSKLEDSQETTVIINSDRESIALHISAEI